MLNGKALKLARTVARSQVVGGNRVAQTSIATPEGDLVVKRFSWTDGGEDKPLQDLVIFNMVFESRNNKYPDARPCQSRNKTGAHTYSVLVLSRGC